MSDIREIADADFDTAVLRAPGLTLVDFWRERCAPCVRLGQMLEGFAAEFDGRVQFVKVDAEKNPGVVEKYDIKAVPTLLFLKGGEVVERMTGVERKAVVRQAIEAHL